MANGLSGGTPLSLDIPSQLRNLGSSAGGNLATGAAKKGIGGKILGALPGVGLTVDIVGGLIDIFGKQPAERDFIGEIDREAMHRLQQVREQIRSNERLKGRELVQRGALEKPGLELDRLGLRKGQREATLRDRLAGFRGL